MAWSFTVVFKNTHKHKKDNIRLEYPSLLASDSSVKLECASLRCFKSIGRFNSVYTYSTAV